MGTDTGYVKVAADPEQVDGTILDGRDYSSGQLPQENIRIIKEADATLRLNLGTQLDALYDRPHKEITNEGGTLIIIHDADSSEWHFFECLVRKLSTPETYAIVLKKSPDQPSPDYPDKKKPPVHHG